MHNNIEEIQMLSDFADSMSADEMTVNLINAMSKIDHSTVNQETLDLINEIYIACSNLIWLLSL